MLVNIYVLSDPRTPHDYRYLGRTIWDPAERRKSHIREAMARRPDGEWRNTVTHKHAWVRAVIRDGYHPIIAVIDTTTLDRRVFVEQQWIAALREAGHRLTNSTSGGEGNHLYKPTGQTRQRQSEANKRRFANNPAEREFYRQKMIRQFGSEEGRQWLSEKATEQWAVPGAREAQSERLKAICADPEFLAKRAESLRRTLLETERGREIREAHSRRLAGEGNHRAKLTWDQVRQIRAEYVPGVVTHKQLGEKYGVTQTLISQIIRCLIWVEEPDGTRPTPPPSQCKSYPPITDQVLAELATVYRAALNDGQPSRAVARHFGIAPVRAYGWIAKARSKGFLGATTPGVPGAVADVVR